MLDHEGKKPGRNLRLQKNIVSDSEAGKLHCRTKPSLVRRDILPNLFRTSARGPNPKPFAEPVRPRDRRVESREEENGEDYIISLSLMQRECDCLPLRMILAADCSLITPMIWFLRRAFRSFQCQEGC